MNLLNNAADAMPQGGTLTLETRRIDPQGVEIVVADTGCGIPEGNLGKLFTPFFTTKPVGKGTGLGLSIVYGIIKMHRGQIRSEKSAGPGYNFYHNPSGDAGGTGTNAGKKKPQGQG